MPEIPRFQPQGVPQQVPQQRVAPDAFSSGTAALSRAGEAAQQFSDRLMESATQNATTQGRIQFTERAGALRASLESEPDATVIRSRWAAESQQIRNEIAAGLPFFARGQFRDIADLQAARESEEVGRLVVRRTREQTEANLAARGQQLQQQAADPRMRDAAIAEYAGLIQGAARSGAIPANRAEALRQDFTGGVAAAAARRAIIANPGQAARDLANPNGPYAAVGEERLASLTMMAISAASAAASRAESALARRERAILGEAGQITDLLREGVLPADRIAALRQLSRGTQLAPMVERIVADGEQVAAFRPATGAEQMRILREADARRHGPGASNDDQHRLRNLAGIVRAQQAAYDSDGINASVTFGLIPALPPLDPSNPATLNARVTAAQEQSVHAGRNISPFSRAEMTAMVQQFVAAPPDARMAIVQGIARIGDAGIRREAITHFERLRGDGGRLPAGEIMRLAEMAATGPEGLRMATRELTTLSADTSGRVRPPGEAAAIRNATVQIQGAGVQGVYMAQARITGDDRYSTIHARDMQRIEGLAAGLIAQGVPEYLAIPRAQVMANHGLAGLNDSGLGHVTFPSERLSLADMRTGLRVLRDRAAEALPAMEGPEARNARAAVRSAVWIDRDGQIVLYATGQGEGGVITRVTLGEIETAARGQRETERLRAIRNSTPEGRIEESRGVVPRPIPITPLTQPRRRPTDPPVMQ